MNVVERKGKRRCDEVCHMINLHPLQLLFKCSHLGTNMSHSSCGGLDLLDLIPLCRTSNVNGFLIISIHQTGWFHYNADFFNSLLASLCANLLLFLCYTCCFLSQFIDDIAHFRAVLTLQTNLNGGFVRWWLMLKKQQWSVYPSGSVYALFTRFSSTFCP